MKTLLFLTFSIISTYSFSQGTFTYEVQRNEPGKAKSITLGYDIGMSGDYGEFEEIQAIYNSPTFAVEFSMQYVPLIFAYEGKFDYSNSIRKNPEYENIKPIYRKSELYFNYFLTKKEKADVVKKYMGFSDQYSLFAIVNVNALKVSGMRPGLILHQGFLENGSTIYPRFDEFSHASISIGYFISKYSDFKVKINSSVKEGRRFRKTYFDLFFSPSSKIKNSLIYSNQYTYKPFGVRLGIQYMSTKLLGLNFKGEIGYFPGAYKDKKDSFYLLVGFGFNFTKSFIPSTN
ncbi:MAG: hypothetical protein CVU05_05395 [Bacteroidetes bacterium HGW-Bacteroidetes-21]|jgi:hypothetical protein|nr:MAG: hypothetical protein CVU05_05395 [Bacteroidetes bacterium HGW-Bacteroidetes-21]